MMRTSAWCIPRMWSPETTTACCSWLVGMVSVLVGVLAVTSPSPTAACRASAPGDEDRRRAVGLGRSSGLPILNAMPSDETPPSSPTVPTVPIAVSDAVSDAVPDALSDAVHVGVLVAPRLPAGVRSEVETGLEAALRERVGDVAWKVTVLSEAVTAGPSESVEVMDAARHVLLERDWDLVLVVTDLPLTEGRRAVVSTCSPVHGVGVVSFPALGSVHTRARTTKLLAQVAMTLVGTDDRDSLRQLAGDTPEGEG